MENQSIQQILDGALELNADDRKCIITIEGNKIITTVKWIDAVFFAPDSVTDEVS